MYTRVDVSVPSIHFHVSVIHSDVIYKHAIVDPLRILVTSITTDECVQYTVQAVDIIKLPGGVPLRMVDERRTEKEQRRRVKPRVVTTQENNWNQLECCVL